MRHHDDACLAALGVATRVGRRELHRVRAHRENHRDLPPDPRIVRAWPSPHEARRCVGRPPLARARAILFRNGLAIAMLAARPLMRRANLAAIVIGEHLVGEGEVYRLRFTAKDMKGGRRRGGPLPRLFVRAIDRSARLLPPALACCETKAGWRRRQRRPVHLQPGQCDHASQYVRGDWQHHRRGVHCRRI